MLRSSYLLPVLFSVASAYFYFCPTDRGAVRQSFREHFSTCAAALNCDECQTSAYCRRLNGSDYFCSSRGCCELDPYRETTDCVTKECHSHAYCLQFIANSECVDGCCRPKGSNGSQSLPPIKKKVLKKR
ncbi:hypothetical protein PMAYCL1PPCAC_11120, partial [Pristionchus mayeri]